MRRYAMVSIGSVGLALAAPGQATVVWAGWFLDTQASATRYFSAEDLLNDYHSVFDNNQPLPQQFGRMVSASVDYGGGSAAQDVNSHLDFPDAYGLTLDMDSAWTLKNDGGATFVYGGVNFSYAFYSYANYAYTLSYDVDVDDASDGPAGFVGLGDQDGYLAFTSLSFHQSGSFSGVLGPGMHGLQLQNLFAAVNFSPDDKSGTAKGHFTFTLREVTAAVPEPASWALMIGGFAMAGAALRTRARPVSAMA